MGSVLKNGDLMGAMFTEDDLKQQQRVKCAFDPGHLLNPGKVYPELHRCAELRQNAHPSWQIAVPRHSKVLG